MNELRYPIGRYRPPAIIDTVLINKWVGMIEVLPELLASTVSGLTEDDLKKLHREDGWTIRQIVHHIADSHLNCYIRYKLALTEDNPTVKTYDEVSWSNLPDALDGPVDMSVAFLSALHQRWVYLLRLLSEEQWDKTFYHSEMGKSVSLKWTLGLYAWHGEHHVAHIRQALDN